MSAWLVTGGAGFIGSHLVDALLRRGDRVRVLDDLSSGYRRNVSPAAELVQGSVTDRIVVRRAVAGTDGVFHLAAVASVARCTEDWAGSHAINQTGTVAVLEAAKDAGRLPVVYASSAAVYGDTAAGAVSERHPPAPRSAYGCDKLGSELHAQVARSTFGVPTLGLRFFNVYGPRQDGASPYSGVISIFRRVLAAGGMPVLNGDGRQTRDMVHVSDVVAALLAGMERLPDLPPVLNVCTGRSTSIRQLAEMLCEAAGVRPAFTHAPARIGDILHSRGDPSLMAASLALRCEVQVGDGLRRLAGFAPGRAGAELAGRAAMDPPGRAAADPFGRAAAGALDLGSLRRKG